jgi:hypothetical protein
MPSSFGIPVAEPRSKSSRSPWYEKVSPLWFIAASILGFFLICAVWNVASGRSPGDGGTYRPTTSATADPREEACADMHLTGGKNHYREYMKCIGQSY